MAWIIENSGDTTYASVHANSGALTYGTSGLCGGVPDVCEPNINSDVTILLEDGDGSAFTPYSAECGVIKYTVNAFSCNQESLVLWFNDVSGTNYSYENVLNDSSIFDVKNVDECRHLIIVNSGTPIHCGGESFDTTSYTDSGYPRIHTEPGNNAIKYESGVTYAGHKYKYHTTSRDIPSGMCSGCSALTEVYFPHRYNDSDERENHDGYNISGISESAFESCKNLSAITLSQVKTIGNSAFRNCTNLKIVDWGHYCIGEYRDCSQSYSVESIGDYAFYNCNKLSNVIMSSGARRIGEHAFELCASLTTVTILKEEPPELGEKAFNGCTSLTDIFVPSEDAVNKYSTTPGWSNYSGKIKAITS